ncbi:MAG: phosphatidate cytidylyltransferase [Acidobacteriota bacterium]
MTRLLTALIGLPLFFYVIKYLPPQVFLVLVSIAVVLASYELFAIAEKRGLHAHRALGAALGVAVVYTFFDPRLSTGDMVCAGAIAVSLASLLRARGGGEALAVGIGGTAVTLLAVVLIAMMLGYCVGLLGDGSEQGRDLTVLLFWVVWLSDAAAYAIGTMWGRHKLMPLISPRKTVEGAVGALVVSIVAAVAARAWFFKTLLLGDALMLGLLLGIAGILGDLVESMMKRAAALKDSGALLPGHGGILDRADSLLFAAPVLFYYHKYFIR